MHKIVVSLNYFNNFRASDATFAMILKRCFPRLGPACILETAKKVFSCLFSSNLFSRIFDADHSPSSLWPVIFIPVSSVTM